MPAQVITITSGKGGVGKTTAVANLAVALASNGSKVVCIDGDIGLRNLDVILGLENRIVYDIVDVIEGRCRLKQAMIRDKKLPNLYLIPAAQTRDKNAVSPSDMNRLIKELRADYDFVLIDSPAGIERGFQKCHRCRRPRVSGHQSRSLSGSGCGSRHRHSRSGGKRSRCTHHQSPESASW